MQQVTKVCVIRVFFMFIKNIIKTILLPIYSAAKTLQGLPPSNKPIKLIPKTTMIISLNSHPRNVHKFYHQCTLFTEPPRLFVIITNITNTHDQVCSHIWPPLQVVEPMHRATQLPSLLHLRRLRHLDEPQLHQPRRHWALPLLLCTSGHFLFTCVLAQTYRIFVTDTTGGTCGEN